MATKTVRVYPDDIPYLDAVRIFLQKQDGRDKTLADAISHCVKCAVIFDTAEIMYIYRQNIAEEE